MTPTGDGGELQARRVAWSRMALDPRHVATRAGRAQSDVSPTAATRTPPTRPAPSAATRAASRAGRLRRMACGPRRPRSSTSAASQTGMWPRESTRSRRHRGTRDRCRSSPAGGPYRLAVSRLFAFACLVSVRGVRLVICLRPLCAGGGRSLQGRSSLSLTAFGSARRSPAPGALVNHQLIPR